MRMFVAIATLFSLLLALSCLAQPNPINRRAVAIAGLAANPFTPNSIPGLAYWWLFTDLATNTAVTNWVDRIQGLGLTNGAAASRPTNSASGVGFNGTTCLTNIPITASAGSKSVSTFIVLERTKNGTLKYLGDSAANQGYWLDTGTQSSGKDWELRQPSIVTLSSQLPTNSIMDLGIDDRTLTSQGGNSYSNGQSSTTVANANWWIPNLNTVGDTGVARSGSYIGFFLEILIYTNRLFASNITALHNFYTNKYGYTP